MKRLLLKSDALLLLTAIIWGFAFVAQRKGMEYVGPFTFNAVRFALGSVFLIPFLVGRRRRRARGGDGPPFIAKVALSGCGLAGVALFMGASLQQTGIVYTTAGKAGFITGIYVIIVPILGFFIGQRSGIGTWIGACCAVVGLHFLSLSGRFSFSHGDLLVLGGAFFWAAHVLIIGWLTSWVAPLVLAFLQYAACAALSFMAAMLVEAISAEALLRAAVPILYGGVLSTGIAYTLQVVAQRTAHPSHAAIILSLEAVFAALGGWLLLDETLPLRGWFGCALILAGIFASELTHRGKLRGGSVRAIST
ncbi:hypothetical protein AMJ71_07885 [candidate division TA06 bacterium SM1_40]|jgi:drug/metabolite transporter (DMT)-like permease|uniref:EamA domain-containing protein n=2 Tax=Bacteria division TA06 TaxID=1156500 RepID=A0A0S8JFR2_UNCT6|nr:MAG: hypothetical protein AMJ82_09615 [candidate division TA06 bacterium SM23_40]KPL08633.1 MAG: hypothetical protein AMJ71_07885 [candidate division TA06 bacterium SM1_40]